MLDQTLLLIIQIRKILAFLYIYEWFLHMCQTVICMILKNLSFREEEKRKSYKGKQCPTVKGKPSFHALLLAVLQTTILTLESKNNGSFLQLNGVVFLEFSSLFSHLLVTSSALLANPPEIKMGQPSASSWTTRLAYIRQHVRPRHDATQDSH